MDKMLKKNGYSLVEVVIALSIIVTVSITAISIVLSSVATRMNAINKTEAQSFSDDVWECFKAAKNQDKFISLVAFARGIVLTEATNDEYGNTVYTYTSEKNKFSAEIKVNFSDTERDEFVINVTDKHDEVIISFSYRKGDGI